MFSRGNAFKPKGNAGHTTESEITFNNSASDNKDITVPTTFQMFPPASTVDNLMDPCCIYEAS